MGIHSHSKAYRHLYGTKRWSQLRRATFDRDEYTCQICGLICIGTDRHSPRAPVCDHKVEHKGNVHLFHDPRNLQTLCKGCHDKTKRGQETRGYSLDTDEHGWPTDPRHPANRRA